MTRVLDLAARRSAPTVWAVVTWLAVLTTLGAACTSQTVIGEGELALRGDSAAATTPSAPSATVEPDDVGNDPPSDEPTASAMPNDDDITLEDLDDEDFLVVDPSQVAALLADCEDGSDAACDVLFASSDFGSIEERIALDCAGRSSNDPFFCTEGIRSEPGEIWFDESSPGLPALVDACEDDGDMTACDLLFFRSPVGSSFEDIGRGCGGRVPVALPDCRTVFPEE
ncbi:MAG: hypothetical protein AAF567_11190 [Actinomycetota bacterium]